MPHSESALAKTGRYMAWWEEIYLLTCIRPTFRGSKAWITYLTTVPVIIFLIKVIQIYRRQQHYFLSIFIASVVKLILTRQRRSRQGMLNFINYLKALFLTVHELNESYFRFCKLSLFIGIPWLLNWQPRNINNFIGYFSRLNSSRTI